MRAPPLVYGPRVNRYARRYKEELLRQLLGKPKHHILRRSRRWPSIAAWHKPGSNIVGIGFGTKDVNGHVTSDLALRVYVRRKKSNHRVRLADRIPRMVNGLPTDVIEVGPFEAAVRPAEGGFSGGSPAAAPGTLGCLVVGNANPANRYILSCLHVLAGNVFAPVDSEEVDEPAGGTPIAELWSWVPFASEGNLMDCATARVLNPADFDPVLRGLGQQNSNPFQATLNQTVKKSGAMAPNVTSGEVFSLTEDHPVNFPQGTVGFVHQIGIRGLNGQPFAKHGDSGSLVVDDATLQPVGVIFAVDEQSGITLVNPIIPILSRLGIALA